MAEISRETEPSKLYPDSREHTVHEWSVPDGATHVELYVSRDAWQADVRPDAVYVRAAIDLGRGYSFLCDFTTSGGIHMKRDLSGPTTQSGIATGLPDGRNRLLKVTLRCRTTITTRVAVIFHDAPVKARPDGGF